MGTLGEMEMHKLKDDPNRFTLETPVIQDIACPPKVQDEVNQELEENIMRAGRKEKIRHLFEQLKKRAGK